jgi:hypothetical protein
VQFRDPEEGFDWLRKAAKQGLASAQYALAQIYASGQNVPNSTKPNVRKAAKWLQMASEQDHAEAKWALAQLLINAHTGIAHRAKKQGIRTNADKLILQAAAAGVVPAMLEAAKLCRHGRRNISPNISEAMKWFQLAAEKVFITQDCPFLAPFLIFSLAVWYVAADVLHSGILTVILHQHIGFCTYALEHC